MNNSIFSSVTTYQSSPFKTSGLGLSWIGIDNFKYLVSVIIWGGGGSAEKNEQLLNRGRQGSNILQIFKNFSSRIIDSFFYKTWFFLR